MKIKKVKVPGLAHLPVFCHAAVAGDYIFVSGTLGTKPNSMELVENGIKAQTIQALRNIEIILKECKASLDDLVKVNVFLSDIKNFQEMNEAYIEVIGMDPPARITVGRANLALGAAVEIDAIAYRPMS